MDIVTLGAALNGAKKQTENYVGSHFKSGSNIQITNNPDGTQTINVSGEVSAEDTVARETISDHISDKANPHEVTAAQVGLGNVDNTADIDKPVSTAVSAALSDKVDKVTGKGLSTNDFTNAEKTKLDNHVISTNNPHQVTKEQVGLGNVDNTSDADKPISTATQSALDALSTRMAASRIDTTVYTKLSDYVDTLGSGTSVFLVPNGSALTDSPLNDSNLIVTATIFNENGAVIDLVPISSRYQSLRYSKIKSAGVWREWYKFTGEQVSSTASLTAANLTTETAADATETEGGEVR
jgi:hypothetical protein